MCFIFSAVSLVFLPGNALAHLVTTGMGPVYDGIVHLLLTPEDLVPVIAIALYAGLRGKAVGRYSLFILPAAWLVGGFAGLAVSAGVSTFVPILSFLLLGVLIAADVRLPEKTISLLITVLGIMYGLNNGVAMKGVAGLLGIAAAVFTIVALVAAVVIFFHVHWSRVVVRVMGSWIAAVGFLMLGWVVKGAG